MKITIIIITVIHIMTSNKLLCLFSADVALINYSLTHFSLHHSTYKNENIFVSYSSTESSMYLVVIITNNTIAATNLQIHIHAQLTRQLLHLFRMKNIHRWQTMLAERNVKHWPFTSLNLHNIHSTCEHRQIWTFGANATIHSTDQSPPTQPWM